MMYTEARFTRVVKEDAEQGALLLKNAQEIVDLTWERLEIYQTL